MKKTAFFTLMFVSLAGWAQTFTTNRAPVGLEHNILFNATSRYTVTQTGAAQINTDMIFDGAMQATYSTAPVSSSSPTVIEISGLPAQHSQMGAWFGWSTRWWMPTRFIMEGYDVYYGYGWVTIADYTNTDYTGNYSFIQKVPAGAYTKLRITIYKSNGTGGKFGLSELFYIHPEATKPYGGLYGFSNVITEKSGNIGIGTTNTFGYKLAVNGTIGAKEVKVETTSAWPDYIFSPNHNLRTLEETEQFITENGHLPDIPSAKQVAAEGISLGEMNAKLLQKIEELTLYMIDMKKENELKNIELQEIKKKNMILEEKNELIIKDIKELKDQYNIKINNYE